MPRIARVSDIKANLLRPATTSHFEVEIPIIDALSRWRGVGKQDKIQMMCSETSLPGSNLATFEINNDRTGVTEKHVHRRIFDDRIDLTFYVDAGLYQPIRFFEDWMDRYQYLIDIGRKLPKMPEEYLRDEFKLKGRHIPDYITEALEFGVGIHIESMKYSLRRQMFDMYRKRAIVVMVADIGTHYTCKTQHQKKVG